MDGFSKIQDKVTALRALCVENIGETEIREISVDLPECPYDELYFRKAVSWLYVLFNETGPFLRFAAKLLRTDSQVSERFKSFKFLVECARTVHAHNLSQENASDEKRKRQHDIWIIQNGGDPVDWVKCCKSLMNEAELVLQDILLKIEKICEIDFDKGELWREYASDKRTHWDVHEFDPIIEKAATDLEIDRLDYSKFRKEGGRQEKWRKYAAMFDSREAAEKAIERAILAELAAIFGVAPIS